LVGGYLGVDVFFVLSGYLITGILLRDVETLGAVRLGNFWLRRARRLLPAMLSLLPAVAAYAAFMAAPEELLTLRRDTWATLLYVANWQSIWTSRDYWELFLAPSLLEHTWSLAIEEQFYLVWPLALAGLFALQKRLHPGARFSTWALPLCLVLFAASVLRMAYLFEAASVSRVYLGTDTRASGMLLGAALAIGGSRLAALLPKWIRLSLGSLSLLLLGVASLFWDGQSASLYRGGFAGIEVLTCLLILACVSDGNARPIAWLSHPVLRYFGTISYGMYLWHWPIHCVITPERTGLGWPLVHGLRWGLTIAVAAISYIYFEQPIRLRGLVSPRRRQLAGLGLCASIALVFVATRPRDFITDPNAARILAAQQAAKQGAASPNVARLGAAPSIFSVSFHDLPLAPSLPQGMPRILVLGDSVAEKLGAALRYRQEEFAMFVAERGVGNCSILPDVGSAGFTRDKASHQCAEHWTTDTQTLTPEVTLIVLGGAFFNQALVAGEWQRACHSGFHAKYKQELKRLISELRPHTGSVVLTLAPYPMGRWRGPGVLEWVDCFDALLREVAAEEHLAFVDLMGFLCPTHECQLMSDGAPIRPDGLHFDGVGAEATARYVLREIQAHISKSPDRVRTQER